MSSCPSEEQLVLYAAAECDRQLAATIDEHLKDCSRCRESVDRAKQDAVWLGDVEQILGSKPPTLETRDSLAPEQSPFAETNPTSTTSELLPLDIEGYEIVRELGRGGQGIVFRALQRIANRERNVAIKVLLENRYASNAATKRFEREIGLVAQLKHPNIITVFHSGITSHGQPFFVMDYVDGRPLHTHVREKGLTLEQTLELFVTVCDAVQYAHQRGTIHRDLKPSNIIVDSEGNPKILDFGLAKQISAPADTVLSMSRQILGTLAYMSPEQVGGNSDEIDTRTDIYALGAILYELLTGHYPIPVDGNLGAILKNITETPPMPPSRAWVKGQGIARRSARRLRLGECPIDDDIQTIVLKALSKERERRYQSANELAADIRHYLAGEPIRARSDSNWYILKKTLHRYRISAAIVVVFVALVLASAVTLSVLLHQVQRERDAKLQLAKQRERDMYRALISAATHAYENNDIKATMKALEQCPEEFRAWEWRYLRRLSDRSRLTFSGHTAAVRAIAFSPDGTRVVSGGDDNRLIVWDAATGGDVVALEGHAGPVFSAAFSTDGRRIVSGSFDRTVVVWDASTGDKLNEIAAHRSAVRTVAFSRSGRYIVSGGTDGSMRMWEAATGLQIGKRIADSAHVYSAVFSPDGDRIASGGGDDVLRVWGASTFEELRTLRGHTGDVASTAFSPDGMRLASGSVDGTVRLWNVVAGEEVHVFRGHVGVVRSVSFSPDGGKIVSGAQESLLRVWDLATGKCRLLRGHGGEVN